MHLHSRRGLIIPVSTCLFEEVCVLQSSEENISITSKQTKKKKKGEKIHFFVKSPELLKHSEHKTKR